jgi:hypothetical protein
LKKLEGNQDVIQIGAMQRPDFEGYSGFLNFIRTSAIHGAIDLDRYGESYMKLGQEIFPP